MKLFKKLNQKGFSHHVIIPIIVVLVITGVGAYILTRAHAAPAPSSSASSTAWADSLTAYHCPANGFAVPATIQQGGNNNKNCVQLAQALLYWGAGVSGKNPDGIFGPITKSYVVSFQKTYHLSVDGIVGPQTWGKFASCMGGPTTGWFICPFPAPNPR